MAEVNDFLNPNSMLTPGIAGSITMMIANTLSFNFNFDPKITALIICLLLGLLVLAELKVALWQKPIYYIINVLVIFSVSVGANNVGVSSGSINPDNPPALSTKELKAGSLSLPNIGSFFINSAVADDDKKIKKIVSTTEKANNKEVKNNSGEVVKLDQKKSKVPKEKERRFFKRWF